MWASHLFWVPFAPIVLWVCILFTQVVAAIRFDKRSEFYSPEAIQRHRRRVAVLVPAHNEGAALGPTLSDITRQLRHSDRLLVVADNCTDDTAIIASTAGAEVAQRHDLDRIGKGYALDFGLRQLSADAPNVVIVIDADCRIADGAIDHLAATCAITHRPAQAVITMTAPDPSPVNYQVAGFAWRVKTLLRPLGFRALNLPCQLAGTGMAFPWDVIRNANLATGSLVEDLKLGLELTEADHPPILCPAAVIMSQFPTSVAAANSQRERWERGHIGLILSTASGLLLKAIAKRQWSLLALTLDMTVPPLSLLAMLVLAMVGCGVIYAFLELSLIPLAAGGTAMLIFTLALVLAWLTCGREILRLSAVFSVVPYMAKKIGLYRRILTTNEAKWIKTDRRLSNDRSGNDRETSNRTIRQRLNSALHSGRWH